MRTVQKAYAITDAKISFVSLVDKAANKRKFLITKAENGEASFVTYGRIIKADTASHFVTGIVYEPMVEDSQGNYMTEEEIVKAFLWYTKNGDKVDIQHSFEPLAKSAVEVVENWIAKADFELNGETIKKGTWLMTVEVTDPNVWDKIQKGEITGFSMGGVGHYSEEDVDLSTIEKESGGKEKRGLLKQLGKLLGLEVVEKGDFAEVYEDAAKRNNFWTAINSLTDILYHYDERRGIYCLETDEATIREVLGEFSQTITDVLAKDSVIKALEESRPVEKSGKALSTKNKETLKGIYDAFGAFLKEFDEPEPDGGNDDGKAGNNNVQKEDIDMTKEELEQVVAAAIAKATAGADPKTTEPAEPKTAAVEKKTTEPITVERIQNMIDAAIKKAMGDEDEDEEPEAPITAEDLDEKIGKAVEKAIAPLLKSRGVPNNLNGSIEKEAEEEHYLHGII